MKLFGKNQNLEQQINDQLSNFALHPSVLFDNINTLESDSEIQFELNEIKDSVMSIEQIVYTAYNEEKSINKDTIKKLLNKTIHMTLYGYDQLEKNVTLQNGEKDVREN